jgi:hypothetical protein
MNSELEDEIYVQFGAGFSPGQGWLNFDVSPTLLIEKFPLFGNILSSCLSSNTTRFPPVIKYGDICRGLPIVDGSVRGVYASHVLEHLSLDKFRLALHNTFTMLQPSGLFRLIVPDLAARAKRYVEQFESKAPDAAMNFMHTTYLGAETSPQTLMQHLRKLVGSSEHKWMWDEYSISAELKRAGFTQIRRCEFGDSLDKMFSKVEDPERFYDQTINIRECAMEARK